MSNDRNLGRIIKSLSKSIALFLRKVLIVAIVIAWGPLCFIVGARLYEVGKVVGVKGSTVFVSGVCKTKGGFERQDLVRDQMVVSSVSEEMISGVLRKTREIIECEKDKVSIDHFPFLADWNKGLIPVQELTEFVPPKKVASAEDLSYKQYMNKDLSVTGLCTNKANQALDPFKDKMVSVINVKKSKEDGSLYFYGITDDKEYVVCPEQEIKFSVVQSSSSAPSMEGMDPIYLEKQLPSFAGKTAYISGLCFPDKRYYDKIGRKNAGVNFYQLTDTLVAVTEDKVLEDESSAEGYRVVKLAGIIKDKTERSINLGDGQIEKITFFGHRVICDGGDGTTLDVVLPKEAVNLDSEIKKLQEEVNAGGR